MTVDPSIEAALHTPGAARRLASRRCCLFFTFGLLACGSQGSGGQEKSGDTFDFAHGDWRVVAGARPPPERVRLSIDGRVVNLEQDLDRVLAYYCQRKSDTYLDARINELVTEDNVEYGRKLKDNVYHFPFHEPTELPADPDWSEDPFSSRNWQFWYHRFHFAEYAIAAHARTRNAWYLEYLRNMLADWMTDNVNPEPPSEFSWHDHATALRLQNLLLVYAVLKQNGLDRDALSTLLTAIEIHCNVLCFDSFYSRHSNHGLDQAYVLFWAGSVFPEFETAAAWRTIGGARVREELRFAFSPEGVHVENSPGYHHGMLAGSIRINRLFRHYTGEDVFPGLDAILNGALTFLAYSARPDGRFPIVGDTQQRPISDAFAEVSHIPAYRRFLYSVSQGRRGERPERADVVYPTSGYAIFRDAWHQSEDFDQAVHLFFKCGYLGKYHRQDDDGTFVLYAYGEDWIIDSGLYRHDSSDPYRRYMRSNLAHNLVFIDGVRPTRDPEALLGKSFISTYETSPARASVTAVSAMYPGFLVRRTIDYNKPDRFTVSDEVTPARPRETIFRVLFHVPADKTIRVAGRRVVIEGRAGKQLVVRPLAGAFSKVYVITGQNEPYIQGWVSYRYGKIEESQCVVFEVKAQRLRSSFEMRFE